MGGGGGSRSTPTSRDVKDGNKDHITREPEQVKAFRDTDVRKARLCQLKRIAREWLDGGYLRRTGGTYPAQLIYQDIADRACERIKRAITESMVGEHPIKAVLDP